MAAKKQRGLGRGLDALLATSGAARQREEAREAPQTQPAPVEAVSEGGKEKELRRLPIEFLQPGKYQPRRDMSPDALEELAASIRAQGVIQPIVVRPIGQDKYEIIAGERRWRASQLAELDQVPCVVREVPDEAAVAIALIENIQREDLNAMEEAVALKRLMTEFELTHQEVADAVGKSRTTVTNLLRLNSLQDDVKLLLEHGDIEMGHARALLALEGDVQVETARAVAHKGLSVRETETLVRKVLEGKPAKVEKKVDPDVERLQTRLSERLGARVAINQGAKGKGKVVISYSSLDELDGILSHLGESQE
ncbi:ParB/RepB/Spo0J family partition protein [Gallaecimonas sp. GXIMD4217]|uniref:ParB/RepB/Spo0J family partition protein n=1 Tax=Gallaecimonas sp. GXIMD4217 TaxID=3131927 RepID=UPI00311AE59F